MTKPIVYTKTNCKQCEFTKKYLSRMGIEYKAINIEDDETAKQAVQALGYQAVPVVFVDGKHWYGFQPDKLAELVG